VGVIPKEEEQRFKRMLFRVTKGNAWITILDIEPEYGQQIIDPLTVPHRFIPE
jgi:V-type H+-transporting ATPase subunit a